MSNLWSKAEVQALLCFVADEKIQSELAGMVRNEKVFKQVSELMAAHGYQRTPKQCREKLKKLRGDYRKIKDHNGRSGSDHKKWKWFDQMDAIYRSRPAKNWREGCLDTATSLLEAINEDACDAAKSSMDPPNLPASQPAPALSTVSATPPPDNSPSQPSTSQSTTDCQPSVHGKRKRKEHSHIASLINQEELNRAQREEHKRGDLADSREAREQEAIAREKELAVMQQLASASAQEASARAQEASVRSQEVTVLARLASAAEQAMQQDAALRREEMTQNAAFNQAFLVVLGEVARAFTHGHVYKRAKSQARYKEQLQGSQTLLDSGTVLDPEVLAAPVDAQEYEHDYAEPAPVSKSQLHSELQRLRTEQIMLKDQIHDLKFNAKSFENNNHKVKYYTGLPSFLMLMTVFDLVKSFIPEPKIPVNGKLGQFECFVMTLMHLKLNLPVQDLAFRFQTSTSTVSRTFLIVIHVLYTRLKNLLYWPEQDVLMKTMPLTFQKHFGQKTAVIIDSFEVLIERPKNVLAHAQTWSIYKHSNTVKFLMGITPHGSVCFLSKSWGGRTSDKCLIENCGLLLKLLPGDLILADHVFNIQDGVESYCAEVNIPSLSNGKAQLSAVDEETTRDVAHVRTPVERFSGFVRNKYTLLQARLPVDYLIKNDDGLPAVDKIVTVACALTNLCDSVVSLT